jgi:hypothetical protein
MCRQCFSFRNFIFQRVMYMSNFVSVITTFKLNLDPSIYSSVLDIPRTYIEVNRAVPFFTSSSRLSGKINTNYKFLSNLFLFNRVSLFQ